MADQPPALEYETPPHPGGQKAWFWWAVLAGIILAVVVIGLMPVSRHTNLRAGSDRAMCASNMHQIGLAILLYQNDNGGVYPPSFDEMLENEPITPAVFICPASNDTAGQGATTQAVLADVHKPGHLSYVYIGQGLTDKTVTDDMVVLYEPLANHGGVGMNILFGDGSAQWFDATVGAKVIAAAGTGRRVHLSSTGVVTTTPMITTKPTTAASPNGPFSPR